MNHELTHDNLHIWGMLAQFSSADELSDGVSQLRDAGYTSLEAYTPLPVDGLSDRLQLNRSPMPWIVLIGGIIGGCLVYALECWINLYVYRLNIGGRPLHSWPSFIPPTFEGTVLFASLFAVVGVVLVCGLPRLHHPVFEIEAFKRASTDGFFLAVKSDDPKFDDVTVGQRLRAVGAFEVWEVPNV